jgi:hypothetical protein
MCLHMKFPDGSSAIICGTRERRKFCACGRAADALCDWKMPEKKSGTCDKPICKQHALQVAPDCDLCPEHQRAFEAWKRRHPGVDVNDLRRKTLGPEPAKQQDLFEGKA